METTFVETVCDGLAAGVAAHEAAHEAATAQRVEELASLSAHLSAATARWLELVWEMLEEGDSSDLQSFLAWRCGITGREAREFLRVAEALRELPLLRAAFGRGEWSRDSRRSSPKARSRTDRGRGTRRASPR